MDLTIFARDSSVYVDLRTFKCVENYETMVILHKHKIEGRKKYYWIACSLCAFRTSGFMFRFAKISVKDAPTIALCPRLIRRTLFFAISSSWPFLCLRLVIRKKRNNQKHERGLKKNKLWFWFYLYNMVQVTLRGFLFMRWARSHFEFKNVKICKNR